MITHLIQNLISKTCYGMTWENIIWEKLNFHRRTYLSPQSQTIFKHVTNIFVLHNFVSWHDAKIQRYDHYTHPCISSAQLSHLSLHNFTLGLVDTETHQSRARTGLHCTLHSIAGLGLKISPVCTGLVISWAQPGSNAQCRLKCRANPQ